MFTSGGVVQECAKGHIPAQALTSLKAGSSERLGAFDWFSEKDRPKKGSDATSRSWDTVGASVKAGSSSVQLLFLPARGTGPACSISIRQLQSAVGKNKPDRGNKLDGFPRQHDKCGFQAHS